MNGPLIGAWFTSDATCILRPGSSLGLPQGAICMYGPEAGTAIQVMGEADGT